MPLPAGSNAPDFILKTMTSDGLVDVRLSASFGRKQTVLLFFPAAFTGVCTQELCEISGGLGQYAELDAEVYGISVDSPFAQEAWAKQSGIRITLLSDLNKTVTRAYGVVFPNLAGMYENVRPGCIRRGPGWRDQILRADADAEGSPGLRRGPGGVEEMNGAKDRCGCRPGQRGEGAASPGFSDEQPSKPV